jgi:hypothetical protein
VRRTGSAVLAGFVVGAASGFVSLELPPLGWMIGVAFLIGALGSSRRVAAIAGLVSGFGVAWIAVLGLAHQACVDFNSPGHGCVEPDLSPWLVPAILMVLLGVALLAILALRRGRRR